MRIKPSKRKKNILINGIILQDHHDTYQNLMDLRRVTLSEDDVYQDSADFNKICKECHVKALAESDQEFMMIPPHNLVHKISADNQTNCTMCNTVIIKLRPAKECRGCIEEYLYADQDYLAEGWAIPVVTRWTEE
ncbi:hypothetical protein RF55_15676 [Lasius niger]|uniref:Uncharacterized protein n=1 Tax=Lasius niger TaxID=67767 RepID=A0A0J7K5W4_LASNI|nr:hypothetical protein RF55_15676 [Lasius niger]